MASETPFGGVIDREVTTRRPNACDVCERSMSDRWDGEVCPFCRDQLECDEDGCDFEAKNPHGLAIHYGRVHSDSPLPEVCR